MPADELQQDAVAVASIGFAAEAGLASPGLVGIRYLRPSEPGTCSETFRPEVVARLPAVIADAVARARRAEQGEAGALPGETTAYWLRRPDGRPAGVLYATRLSASGDAVSASYLAGIAADCGAHKSTDLRFMAASTHYQLLAECSELSVTEAARLARSLDEALHPLVAGPLALRDHLPGRPGLRRGGRGHECARALHLGHTLSVPEIASREARTGCSSC